MNQVVCFLLILAVVAEAKPPFLPKDVIPNGGGPFYADPEIDPRDIIPNGGGPFYADPEIEPRDIISTVHHLHPRMKEADDDKIVNGRETGQNAYPFMARLIVKHDNGDEMLCGGSLINKQYVLSAAHCVYHPETGRMAIGVDAYFADHNQYARDPSEEMIQVSEITTFGYNPRNMANDVVLLQLSRSPVMSSKVKPACLPAAGEDHTGATAKAIGWGAIGEGKQSSRVLLEITIPILSNAVCQNGGYRGFNPSVMICGGYTDGTGDTCQGDSGGPLFLNQNGNFLVVGLTSFGKGCASYGFPGVYARVSTFTNEVVRLAASGGSVCIL